MVSFSHCTERNRVRKEEADVFIEGPAMLGSPELSAVRAFRQPALLPSLNEEEERILGSAIYEGRLAAGRLDSGESVGVDEYFMLETQREQGLDARRAMATRHLGLVLALSHKFAYNQERKYDEERHADMIGIGNLALVKCLDKYIPIPGKTFASFAYTCIKNDMIAEIMATARTHTGRSHRMQRTLLAVDAAYQEAQKAGVEVSFLEIAEKMGYSEERISKILSLSEVFSRSLDDPVINQIDHGLTFGDKLADPNAASHIEEVEDEMLLDQIWRVATDLKRRQLLTDVEWGVFNARYTDGLTQEAIAGKFEIVNTQGGVARMEQRILERIRREIETPGYNDKKVGADLRIVESAVDLLEVLNVPFDSRTDLLKVARNLLDNIRLTTWQREVMHALLGTQGKHYRPKEFARSRQRTHRAIYDARENAMRNIFSAWAEMSDEEKAEALHTTPESPVTAKSTGPKPNTITNPEPTPEVTLPRFSNLSTGELLQQAVLLKPRGRLTKNEVAALAASGHFADLETLRAKFRTWEEFQALFTEVRRQSR